MPDVPIDTIITELQKLSLPQALAYLATNKLFDFVYKRADEVKRIIRDKQNEQRYAFVPNPEEAEKLKHLSSDKDYQNILALIPNYKHIDLIRTGLLIKKVFKIKMCLTWCFT